MEKRSSQLPALVRLALLALTVGFAVTSVPGELLFSESFDYPTGDLAGNGPPPGSPPGQGAWVTLARNPQVGSTGLIFRGIHSVGNAASLGDDGTSFDGDIAAAASAPLNGGSGTAWVGFLIQPHRKFGFATLTFNDGFGPTAPQFGVIYGTGQYGIDNNIIPTMDALTGIKTKNRTVWLVVKLNFDTGEQFLFFDPPPRQEPSEAQASAKLQMAPEFQAGGFDRVVLKEGRSSSSCSFDEIRVGTTFADLTP